MRKIILLILLALLLALPLNVQANTNNDQINIYLIYSHTCPHCKDQIRFLDAFTENNPDVAWHGFEILRSEENQQLRDKIQDIMGNQSAFVPFTIIGTQHFVGFNTQIELEIQRTVEAYRESGNYRNVVGEIIDGSISSREEFMAIKNEASVEIDENERRVPILGNIDARTVSLPLLAATIGWVDGFNPCAMWVLIFLITMCINMNDKRRMLIIGLTFLVTSALVYLFFMVVWLNIIVTVANIIWVRYGIGLFAIGAGTWSLRSFIKAIRKDDGCDVMDDKKRKRLMTRVKKITTEKSLPIALVGVVLLAFSVNLVEMACSAGLPLVFTQILAVNDLSLFETSLYLGIYIFFFMINHIIIFLIAVFTFNIAAVSNKFTKYSYLIGGLVMLILGILLIFRPEWVMFNF